MFNSQNFRNVATGETEIRLEDILPDGEDYEPWKERIREIVGDFRISHNFQVSK